MQPIKILVVVFAAVVAVANCNPLPQEKDQDTEYGDYDPDGVKLATSEDPIGELFGQVADGFGKLFTEGVDIFSSLANGETDINDSIGDAIEVGIDATQEAATIGLNAVQAAPKILEGKVEFVQGLGKTVQETSGVVKQGLSSVSVQAKVASAFAKTYGQLALEGVFGFFNDFGKRLKCNTSCEKMAVGSKERATCEKDNCIEIKNEMEEAEEYDYSYGLDEDEQEDDSANEVAISPRDGDDA